MLNFITITAAAFYREVEGKQLAMVTAGATQVKAAKLMEVPAQEFESTVNVGKFVKRSKDFYRLLPDGNKSYGSTKGHTIYKAINAAGKTIYVLYEERPGYVYNWLLVYRLEEA